MTSYTRTMREAREEMLQAESMSSAQIDKLKKAYEPMRDKKISAANANKLSAMMDKFAKDKDVLIQLFKADIPFVSQSAVTKLIIKYNMKGAELNKLRERFGVESVELDEMKSKNYALAVKGKFVAVGSKADMMKMKKQKGGEVYMSPGAKVGGSPGKAEDVDLDEALNPKDKKVVDAFYDGRSMDGKMLSTDGKKLEKTGMGGQTIASKSGSKFKIVAKMDSSSTQDVVKYIEKSFPKNVIEEVDLDEAKMSSKQIAALKKAYEPMRGGRLSMDNATKLGNLMDRFDKDKDLLIQLFKADIPFVSKIAMTRLISKHKMKGAELNKLADKDEFYRKMYGESLDEDGHADVASAIRQCKTVMEDAQQIMAKLQTMSPEDSLPTWWTNKFAVASNSMNKMRDYIVNPLGEGLDEDYEEIRKEKN